MKKIIPIILGVILTVVLALWLANSEVTHRIYDNDVNTATYGSLGIPGDEVVYTQDFICEEDTIDGIGVKSNIAGAYQDVEIKVVLKDAETGEILSEGVESGANIKARKMHIYDIASVSGLKGKLLTVELTEKGGEGGNGVEFYYQQSPESTYKLHIDGDETTSILVMKTVTERFGIEKFIVLLLSEWFIWGFMWFLYKLFQ